MHGGSDTLVGGLGANDLTAGAGNDTLYASYNAAAWSQGEAAAAAVGVHVVPPQLFQGDSTLQEIYQYLLDQETQPGGLTADQLDKLYPLFSNELTSLQADANESLNQLESDLNTPNLAQSQALENQLNAQKTQANEAWTEVGSLIQLIPTTGSAGDTSFLEDTLLGGTGSGEVTLYGAVGEATYMGGGGGKDFFYNYNANDTIEGGSGSNTLVLQDDPGNNAITLGPDNDTNNPNAVDLAEFTDNGQTLLVGNAGGVSGVQNLEIQLGSGNDTVTVSLTSMPSGVHGGLSVLCGTGNDVVDASAFTGQESLTGGAGNDVIKVGAVLGSSSQLSGTPTTELELELQNVSGYNSVTVNQSSIQINSFTQSGVPINSADENLGDFGAFGKLVVVGGSGSNSFSSSGIPNVVLEGGSGANNFSVSGGTATLIGGESLNSFTLNGPGNYTVEGGSGTNALVVQADDKGDAIHLAQTLDPDQVKSTVNITGAISAQITGINVKTDSVSVVGGSGNDWLDASGMIMGITLDGGGGADTLVGGAGNDTFDYSAGVVSYDGGTGSDNSIVYADTDGDPIIVGPTSLRDGITGASYPLGTMTRIEYIDVSGSEDDPLQIWPVASSLAVTSAFEPSGVAAGTDSVAVQPDGKILVAGSVLDSDGDYYQTLFRFNPDGTLDTTFYGGGEFEFDGPSGSPSTVNSIVVQPNGQILVAGSQGAQDGFYSQTLFCFNSDGTLDTSFNGGGGFAFNSGPYRASANSIALQSVDNSTFILVAGSEYTSIGEYYQTVYQFNENGTAVAAFGSNGTGGIIFDPSGTASQRQFCRRATERHDSSRGQ